MDARKAAQYVALSLPAPISTNDIWRAFVRNGRATNIKSKKYRDWIIDAGKVLEAQAPGCVPGRYSLRIKVPKKCRIDLDNCVKCVGDLLQEHRVIENDRYMDELIVSRGDDESMNVMIITMKGETDDRQHRDISSQS